MSLSRLAGKCRECPDASKCNHKCMEALAEAELPEMNAASAMSPNMESLIMPNMRETQTIHAYGKEFKVYKDELAKEINKSFAIPSYLCGGR